MITKEEIAKIIQEGLPSSQVDVKGDDGHHFEAIVVSEEFAGKSRVKRHQMVYKALGNLMEERLHALALKTITPEEMGN